MTVEQIASLLGAGFNVDQIKQIGAIADQPEPTLEPKPEPEPEPKPEPKQDEKPPINIIDIVSQTVTATVAQLQKANILLSNQPKTDTVDDVLASIIAPPRKD